MQIAKPKNSELYLTKNSGTLFYKRSQDDGIKVFKLPELNTKSEFVFRSWNPESLLKITKDNYSISGKIILFF